VKTLKDVGIPTMQRWPGEMDRNYEKSQKVLQPSRVSKFYE
jgi:hypothetical protein